MQPTTTYDLRFASKNLVGFSEWGAGKQLTMPQRGPPEKPRISTMVTNELNQLLNAIHIVIQIGDYFKATYWLKNYRRFKHIIYVKLKSSYRL